MNLTRRQLKTQFDRAVQLGWLPFFEEAAKTITKGYYDTADLMGIGSRETNLDKKWLTKAGDGGNGFGLMQADKRSFPEFTHGDGWKDARTGILFGAKVLMQKQRDYEETIGKRVSVKGNSYTGKAASGATAQHIVISSYNCGRWAQYAYAKGIDIDKYSTGHDYGRDVMERAAVIRSFLQVSTVAPTPAGHTDLPTGNKPSENPPDGIQTDPTDAAVDKSGDDSKTVEKTVFTAEDGQGESKTITSSTNVAIGKEEQLGFLDKIKLKLAGWFATLGGLTGLNEYKHQLDDFGLPGWIVVYLILGTVIAALLWFLYEAVAHLLEWWAKRKRTDTLAQVNSTPTNTVLIVPQDQLAQYADKGWVVIHRSTAPDSPEQPKHFWEVWK